jgi:hypothetical protein
MAKISAIAIPPIVMMRKRNGENRSKRPAESAAREVLETLVITLFIAISLVHYDVFEYRQNDD